MEDDVIEESYGVFDRLFGMFFKLKNLMYGN